MTKHNQSKEEAPQDEPKEEIQHKVPEATEASGAAAGRPNFKDKLLGWVLRHKKVAIPAAVAGLLLILAAVPATRYALAGALLKQQFSVVVTDSQTGKPVSKVTLNLKGKLATTDSQGKAAVTVPVGNGKLMLTKQYYKTVSQTVLVPIKRPQPLAIKLEATGRQVPVTVVNKISGKALANATISAENTQAVTDKNGEATIVLPADKQTVAGTITASSYNKASVTITITAAQNPANTFSMVPAGELYFLSNQSGKIDLVKSDLDGQNRKVVLPGTGKEDKTGTVLLASRDWKWIALLSKRDGGDNAKLFLIDTRNDQLTTIDEGDASFAPYGWSGDRFIYKVIRTKVPDWQPKQQALKSYSASNKSVTILDETTAAATSPSWFVAEYFGDVYIHNKEVVYTKDWQAANSWVYIADRQATLDSVQADGSQKRVVKTYAATSTYSVSIDTRPGGFNEIYVRYYTSDKPDKPQYDSYEDGKIKTETMTDQDYYQGDYHTYIVSPSDNHTLWTEYRDGKNVFFVGDDQGQKPQEIGRSEDYTPYGWFTDEYVLVTKKGSELHIMPASGLGSGMDNSLKVSDYYKPDYLIRGYGYGYGG